MEGVGICFVNIGNVVYIYGLFMRILLFINFSFVDYKIINLNILICILKLGNF